MQKVFLNTESTLNAKGIYALQFHSLGVPHTIVIDDYLPLTQGNNTILAHAGDDKSLWGPIFEKAFAKYHGNYLQIAGGWPTVGARTVAGGPGETYSHSEFSADDLWTMLKKHDGLDDILQAGTPGTSDRNTNEYGLVNSHAYTVIGVKELSSGDRLVHLRNPWGSDSFNGDWSDKSDKWTAALRQEAGATDDQ